MTVLIILSCLVLSVWVLGFVKSLRLMDKGRAVRHDDDRPVAHPPPLVSICLPARNEEDNLEACLRSLRAQDYPNLEIVVVDDQSTDRTYEILSGHAAADPRIKPIRGTRPPPGWHGKPHALRQAVERSQGDWLLFTDADTVHTPSGVRNALGYALEQQIAALSLTPNLVCVTFWEKLVIPAIATLAMTRHDPKKVNNPNNPRAFGNGAFILVRRDAYDQVGGMGVAQEAMDEDVVLVRALKKSGLGYRYLPGHQIFWTRMYHSLGGIFRGFSRNVFSTMGKSLWRLLSFTLFSWVFSLVPISAAAYAVVLLAQGATDPAAWMQVLGVACYLLVTLIQTLVRARSGFAAWMSVLSPLSGMMAWLVVANSARLGLWKKSVTWKGRTYNK